MKKIFSSILCTLGALAVFSCAVDELNAPSPIEVPDGYTLQKFTANIETRTAYDNGQTVWSEGDQINIYWDNGHSITQATLTDGAGTGTGTFEAVLPEGAVVTCAIYPTVEANVEGTNVTLPFRADQEGTFAAGNMAISKVGEGNVLNFYNVNSFIAVQLKSDDITKIEVESVAAGPLVGNLPVNIAGDEPVFGDIESASSSVSMTAGVAGIYYISVLPGMDHDGGLLLKYYKGEEVSGTYMLDKALTTQRSHILKLGEFEPDGNYFVTVGGAGRHTGLSWADAFSKAEMWALLAPDADSPDEVKAAKAAAVDGAVFHLGAGTYELDENPVLRFDGEDPVKITFVGDYPAEGGEQDRTGAANRAWFTGAGSHAALILRGNLDVTLDGIGITGGKGVVDEENADETKYAAALDVIGENISLTMRYCEVKDNTHADADHSETEGGNWGAGIRFCKAASFTADSVTFARNIGFAAAGLSMRKVTTASLTNCKFLDNSSVWKGGAVFNTTGTDATFTGCTFEGNRSKTASTGTDTGKINGGGAISQTDGASTLTNCVFINNSAYNFETASTTTQGYGGAISLTGGNMTVENCSFSGNNAWRGGALWSKSSGTVTVNNSTFTANGSETTRGGGVAYLDKGVTFNNCTFGGDTPEEGNKALYGGALEVCGGDNAAVNGGVFKNNYAYDCAGAISQESNFTLGKYNGEPTYFINNVAVNTGGAMFFEGKGTANITGAVFRGNTITADNGEGGAVRVDNGTPKVNFIECTFGGTATGEANVSPADGGAFSAKVGTVKLTDCVFIGNHAALQPSGDVGYGGAIDCFSDAAMTINGGTFQGNSAKYGGAINLGGNNKEININDVTFVENVSTQNGGVARVNPKSGKKVIFKKCTMRDNQAKMGGALYCEQPGLLLVRGGTIDGNHADYGGALCTSKGSLGDIEFNGVTIKNCYAIGGGAFLLRGTGKVSASTYEGEGTLFLDNYADDGKFELGKNYSFGGAIKMESNTTLQLFRAMLVGNHAECGGAIYADNQQKDGDGKASKFPILFIDECSFDGNYITNSWGPAIALDGYEHFILNNSSFRNSYTTNADADYQKNLRPSWICIDGIKRDGDYGLTGDPAGTASISNCSIIGNVQYSADGQSFTPLTENTTLVAVWGPQTNYFTNNLILADNLNTDAIRGEGTEIVDLYYNHLAGVNAVTIAAGDVGNVIASETSSSLGNLTWVASETNGEQTTRGFWQWDGQINGAAPTMALGTEIKTKLATLAPAFDSWLGGDREMDQRRVTRSGENWWPGAYQAN
ncbi:MAG: hypothetical protein IK045_02895 [Bacteroidales bacterium]|nr:hypothetical protein [Bacteroidales bacterium]